MAWLSNEDEASDVELLNRFAPFALLFGLFIGALFLWSNRCAQIENARKLKTRSIAAVIYQKYIDKQDHGYRRIYLRYVEEDIYFPGSWLYYDSLQVGDSLYKPSGSTYFYLVGHQNGVRTLRRLLNDSL
ncbi:hypothetical protein [Hymenobacter sediminicola]|uniref:Uncharacterized protein n=1 Tax=Hymenobacter sediminicola TaxID=2761579 RepID=A0A7G7W5R8_9BACT|nr:hypothetical protein [Hymenobacter sediminicola]QNH61711.1 hypothetical protein H4317_16355 [Hymenobacter sediminicola]